MNKKEAEDYVYQSYVRAAGRQHYHTRDMDRRNPELSREIIAGLSQTPCVVVTGSKGKGSVSTMISQIMQTEKKVGLMTSPHLTDFCERFKINGRNISDSDFIRHIKRIKPAFDLVGQGLPEHICISPMGIQTALALSCFYEQKTDFNILEGGKGAKYDDVNNADHQYAVINSIFLEHTRELGSTLAEIAADKAHVINGCQRCVYVAQQADEVMAVIKSRAARYGVPVKAYGVDFTAVNITYTGSGMLFDVAIEDRLYKDIRLPLLGEHQARNCALAMALCSDVLNRFRIEEIRIRLAQTDWPGRMEVISTTPFMLLDACINRDSCEAVKRVLKHLNHRQITLIAGIPDDKDYAGVVAAMQDVAQVTILTKTQNPYYQFTSQQQETLARQGIDAVATDSVVAAISRARQYSNPIVILGTTAIVSEVKQYQQQKCLL